MSFIGQFDININPFAAVVGGAARQATQASAAMQAAQATPAKMFASAPSTPSPLTQNLLGPPAAGPFGTGAPPAPPARPLADYPVSHPPAPPGEGWQLVGEPSPQATPRAVTVTPTASRTTHTVAGPRTPTSTAVPQPARGGRVRLRPRVMRVQPQPTRGGPQMLQRGAPRAMTAREVLDTIWKTLFGG